MITRRLWKCPRCGRRWDIPAGFDPQSCPKCAPAASDSAASDSAVPDSLSADTGERDVRSFFAPFVVEASACARRPPHRPDRGAARPASEPAFFVPLATESHALHAAVAEEPDVFRKCKRRSETPFVAIVACVGGCLLMVGLIVYQKTKSHAGAANAVKGVVEGELNRPGVAGSPRVAGTRNGRTETTAAQEDRTQLGVDKGFRAQCLLQKAEMRQASSFAALSSGLPLWHDRVDRSIVSVHWPGRVQRAMKV